MLLRSEEAFVRPRLILLHSRMFEFREAAISEIRDLHDIFQELLNRRTNSFYCDSDLIEEREDEALNK